MRMFAYIVAILLAIAGLTAPASAQHGGPNILVIGDSISARNTSANPSWWTYLSGTITTSAEGGSGYLRRGVGSAGLPSCTGTNFGERLGKIVATHPDRIIVEGGINDRIRCHGRTILHATPIQTKAAIKAYMMRLASLADSVGTKRSNVYIFLAGGKSYHRHQVLTKRVLVHYARNHHFTYVPCKSLPNSRTSDGTHPTRAGNKIIGSRLNHASA